MKYKVSVTPDTKAANAKLRGRVAYQKQYLRFLLGHVDADDETKWDADNHRCYPRTRHGKDNIPASVINSRIDSFVNAVDSFFILHELDPEPPSVFELSAHIRKKLGLEEKAEETDSKYLLFRHYERFLVETSKKESWSDATLMKYRTLKNDLEREYPNLRYPEINEEFIVQFRDKLARRGNRTSTVKIKLREFRFFLDWARTKGLCPRLDIDNFTPRLKTIERPVIFLTWPELMKVWNLQFKPNEAYLERARDLFCFLCFTGLRYSDLAKFEKSHISYDRVNGATLKTGSSINVELNDYSRAVIEKYKDYEEMDEIPNNRIKKKMKPKQLALPVISSQKLNKYIKEFAEKAGINTPITISYYVGSKRHDETKPKYELLSCHAGRRTFICTALSLNIPITTVMEWSGHASFKSMKPYISASAEHRRKEMNKFNNASEILE